jgi:hypothetical protein
MQESADFPSRDVVYAKLRQDLDRYGWSVVSTIYRGELFTHTVGLSWGYEHPEIEIIGLNEEVAAMLLNALARRVLGGERFGANCKLEDIVDDVPLILVENPLNPHGEPLTNGRLRLIWPDDHNRFPWEKGCDPECRIQQWFPDSTMPDRETCEAYALLEQAALG